MSENRQRSIEEMVRDDKLMTEAIGKGVREALLSHARAGNSVPIQEDGQVIWLSPEEIFKRLGCPPGSGAKANASRLLEEANE